MAAEESADDTMADDAEEEEVSLRYASIDVGVRNLGIAIMTFYPKRWHVVVEAVEVRDITSMFTDRVCDCGAIDNIFKHRIVPACIHTVFVEMQPPIGNANVIRRNSFVEGAVMMACAAHGLMCYTVSPSAVKRFFSFKEVGQQHMENAHARNKKTAIQLVMEMCHGDFPPKCRNDHVCDAVLNALYAIKTGHSDKDAPTFEFSF
jgi:hypothetical protein